MTADFTFGKEERLKSSLGIQDLLKTGQSVSEFPLKIYWKLSADTGQRFPVKMAISVPKRKFRRAVDRNLVKRKIRETYRTNKGLIYNPLHDKNIKVTAIMLFLSDDFISYPELDNKMKNLLHKFALKF